MYEAIFVLEAAIKFWPNCSDHIMHAHFLGTREMKVSMPICKPVFKAFFVYTPSYTSKEMLFLSVLTRISLQWLCPSINWLTGSSHGSEPNCWDITINVFGMKLQNLEPGLNFHILCAVFCHWPRSTLHFFLFSHLLQWRVHRKYRLWQWEYLLFIRECTSRILFLCLIWEERNGKVMRCRKSAFEQKRRQIIAAGGGSEHCRNDLCSYASR